MTPRSAKAKQLASNRGRREELRDRCLSAIDKLENQPGKQVTVANILRECGDHPSRQWLSKSSSVEAQAVRDAVASSTGKSTRPSDPNERNRDRQQASRLKDIENLMETNKQLRAERDDVKARYVDALAEITELLARVENQPGASS